jgi:hypothetical protein
MNVATKEEGVLSSTSVPFYELTGSYRNTVRNRRMIGAGDLATEVERDRQLPSSKRSTSDDSSASMFDPKMNEVSRIITKRHMRRICACLPSILKYRNWQLAFSNYAHGSSLNTFYRQCESTGPNVIIMQDNSHHIFGGFASESWKQHKLYYGNGD